MKKIRVFIVDDHQLVRDGIKWQFNRINNIEVTGESDDGIDLADRLKSTLPDIIIFDASRSESSGIELTRTIISDFPGIKVLIISDNKNENFIFDIFRAGAMGYLPRSTSRKELLDGIDSVFNGRHFIGESISEIIIDNFIKRARSGEEFNEKKEINLTSREIEILKLVAGGAGNKEIANKLFISIRTVASHKNHIMQKLDVESPVDLIRFAIKNRIIEID